MYYTLHNTETCFTYFNDYWFEYIYCFYLNLDKEVVDGKEQTFIVYLIFLWMNHYEMEIIVRNIFLIIININYNKYNFKLVH